MFYAIHSTLNGTIPLLTVKLNGLMVEGILGNFLLIVCDGRLAQGVGKVKIKKCCCNSTCQVVFLNQDLIVYKAAQKVHLLTSLTD